MKNPKVPPDFSKLSHQLPKGLKSILDLVTAAPGALVKGKYLHWDELLRRKAPEDLSHEEWWFALKFHRQGQYSEVPLLSTNGSRFKYLTIDPILEQLHQIDKNAAGRIQADDPIINESTKDEYYIDSLMREAITSSRLEGATTTRRVAKEMLRSGREPRDTSERMILNNFITMRQIGAMKDQPLTQDLVFEIHRLITDQTLNEPSQCGRFRRHDETVNVFVDGDQLVHTPPAAGELPSRLDSMCRFAKGDTHSGFLHPVLRSIILHFWLAYDHPFVDGNGRTARALFYWSMLKHGYWLFEYLSISEILAKAPIKYTMAYLYTETDENDLTYFILYQLEVILRAIEELQTYVERKVRNVQRIEKRLSGVSLFNHRQRALISHALRHPISIYTIQGHTRSHNVTYQTGRSDLLHLAEYGLLHKKKRGRTWSFTPVKDLEERLQSLGNN